MAEIDMDKGVASIAEGLGLEAPDEAATELPEVAAAAAPPVEAPVERAPPKSWAKETHDFWKTMDPKAQDYIEQREKQMLEGLSSYKEHNEFGRQVKDVFTPYKQLLEQQGIDEVKAVQYLMGAHARLMTLPQNERLPYLQQIARSYGVEFGQPDSAMSTIQQQINHLTQALTQQQQREYESVKTKVQSEVTTFADAKDEKGNPLHPYFDEVADDIVAMIQAGRSLQDAYKSAIWSNPVTREKELARIRQEADANLRSKSKQEAIAAQKASAANVRSRDTRAAPTEPLGKMDDTLKSTLDDIRQRAH
jgi:uncharacterized protein YukE